MTPALAAAQPTRAKHTRVDPARLATMLLVLLVALLAVHAAGAVSDFAAAIRSPLELDYGEGIVWQQAALIPGPSMYADVVGLPLIVFHYPPIYHLLVRALATVTPGMLEAGRLVASMSTLALVPLIAALVLAATRQPGRPAATRLLAAATAGLLVLSLLPVRYWGMVMRVDMPGLAFGFAGLLVAARAEGRFLPTAAALLLCLLAVFTKQTLLSFGIAVFVTALLQRPLPTLAAAATVATIGAAAVLLLQAETAGGFLHHIVGHNINRFSLQSGTAILSGAARNLPLMLLSLAAAAWLLRAAPAVPPTLRPALRLVLLHFALASLTLVTMFKVGSAINYLLEWSCSGAVVLGIALATTTRHTRHPWSPALLTAALVAGVSLLPIRIMPGHPGPGELRQSQALARRIAAAPRPVASENMVLLMQSGRGVLFEPAIATELAHLGRWDEAPLVDMIRNRGFAFILTSDDGTRPTDRRTPAVNQAMLDAYPTIHEALPGLWLREP